MDQIKKILFILSRKQKSHMFLLSLFIVVSSVMEMGSLALLVPFIDAMTSPSIITKKWYLNMIYEGFGIPNQNVFLLYYAIALIVLFVFKNIYLGFMYSLIFRFTYNNQWRMAKRIMSSYLKQPYLYFTRHNSAELIRSIDQDTMMFFDTISCSMMLLNEIIVCGLLVVVLFISDPTIALGITLLLSVCMLTVLRLFKKELKKQGELVRESRGGVDKWLLQTFGGIKETKVANREAFFLNNVDKNYYTYAESHRKSQILQYLPKPIMEMVCICGVLLVVAVKLFRGTDPGYFVATLSVFAVAAFRLLPAFNRILNYFSRIMFNRASVNSVYDDLVEVEKLEANGDCVVSEDAELSFNNSISIRNLSFRYPCGDKDVLSDITLEIEKNKSIALIGPSGAGKTTLADIILGVLPPTKGKVLVDGVDVADNMTAWHKMIGYIPQNIFLMDDTIRNNILYGADEDENSEQKIQQAVEDAQLSEVIAELDDGLDTIIGERGIRLSGGQRQRIGIARALYNDPQVLVLDEATSALDNDTEKAIMEAIDNLAGKKTLVIIAHRLSTIKNCNNVYHIEDGNLIIKK